MIKKNWKILLITSLVILLPMIAGVVLWNQLPQKIPSHWNAVGEVDGWSSKPFAVFGLPLMMLGFHWICVVATCADPKKKNYADKLLHLVFWLIPVITIVLNIIVYLTALGMGVRTEVIMPIVLGLLFVIVGNYLPKCKQNYTIGIKIPWTLDSEENWNKTHRLAGWTWTFGGLAMIATAFFGGFWALMGIALVMSLVPVVYSYILHRKGV